MIRSTVRIRTLLVASLLGSIACPAAVDPLIAGWEQPPPQTKPWCYWYWISDNISREGLTRDLEAMARVGIGEALVGNIFLDNQPAGPVKVLSEGVVQLTLNLYSRSVVLVDPSESW